MKIKLVAASLLSAMLFAGCTVTNPNIPIPMPTSVGAEPLKIKRMAPVSYEYEVVENGCSEIEFLKKFVGKSLKTDEGLMRIDNVTDIRKNVYDKSAGIFMLKGDRRYKCMFWGLALEYAK